HAACHCTHAGLEATRSLLTNGVDAGEIERITLIVNPSILDMCGIPEPVTGLEAKFSLRGTQALLVAGADTTAAATFDDGPINRPDVQAMLRRVVIETDDTLGDLATRVEVLTPGGVHRAAGDVSRPSYDIGAQGELLRTKFNALAVPVLGETAATALAERLSDLIAVAEVGDLLALSR
ncbi:MAG: hypothetical protein OXH58_12335, partial [Acidimicrobiaceae bacterium]|nr:hypothetical protein [Acidimicrobiaceae bacterium]